MDMSSLRIRAAVAALLFALWGSAQEVTTQSQSDLYSELQTKLSLMPQINGTIRAKYEYEPQIEKGRFEVRNARLSVTGRVIPSVVYKAEIDLSDEGAIKMLDAYVRYRPDRWSVTIGQMRVPFTIDAHRSPHQQYFANRSFIAKQVGNVRDVGLAASWLPIESKNMVWTIEGGIFNGSGLTDQKDYWTDAYNFSLKTYATVCRCITLEMSCQKTRPEAVDIMMWDAGGYFDNGLWHIEGEYLRKCYRHGTFPAVDAWDTFAAYRFPLKGNLRGVSVLGRYDFMSNHSNGVANDEGFLYVNDPARHRATGGVTLHFGEKKLWADIRINYEKYFYRASATESESGRDKFVVEVVARF